MPITLHNRDMLQTSEDLNRHHQNTAQKSVPPLPQNTYQYNKNYEPSQNQKTHTINQIKIEPQTNQLQ
ncbi:hypothetical protein D3C80_1952810 [compost metagenome]